MVALAWLGVNGLGTEASMKLAHYSLVRAEGRQDNDGMTRLRIRRLRSEHQRSPEGWQCLLDDGWSVDVAPKDGGLEGWIWAPGARDPAMFLRVERSPDRPALVLTDHERELRGDDLDHCHMIARATAWAWLQPET